ncbi:MAG: NapH/MauN family ferredoxin-type protein [Hyphomicrobiales bacterium]|nr:NapH/MauN family ferredoxin-type protein [Hyphomicrobiales bacterium]MCP5371186.1 NapH/MauN family ferredoxin-type protein [Hyphomicrobiales bacterium]
MTMLRSIATMLGAGPAPRPEPDEYAPEAAAMYEVKSSLEGKKERVAKLKAERDEKRSHKWRNWRWFSIVVVNLLFVASFQLDIQLVEGALTASRVVGFHFADLNSSLQVMLAYKVILINLVIGTVTVFLLWWTLGGRTFCSWVCPYHLLAEFAETLHLRLAKAKLVTDLPLHRGTRTVLYVVFVVLALVTGYTVFEAVSPVGILSRALIYGPGLAMIWVGGLLLIEVFITRRAWCRYICPIGLTYGIVGVTSPVHVKYNIENCLHEGDCRKVCMVPHVLEVTKKGYSKTVDVGLGPDCTRCGLCIDVCPTESLKYEVRGLNKLL